MRRAQDIFFSLLALVVLSPLLLLTCIAVWIDSPGASPVFSQLRVGRNGKLFRLYKFRSMCPNAESKLNDLLQDNEMDGPVFKMKDDPRITRVGHFIRKTSIDELPQFINVLRGDMSIVGPRPHMLQHTEQYSKLINKYMVRHLIKPGITGWAQVTGYRGETHSLSQMEGRVRRDIWYLENWSLLLDIRIIFMTVWNALRQDENAY